MDSHNSNPDSTTDSTNSTYQVIDSLAQKTKIDLQQGQQNTENIISKTKKLMQQQWDQARHSLVETRKKDERNGTKTSL